MKEQQSAPLDRLLSDAKNEDNAAFSELAALYAPLLSREVSRYSAELSEADKEDMYQVSLLAFYRAVRNYDMSQNEVEFGLYAKICIQNALASQLRIIRRHTFEVSVPDETLIGDASSFDDPAGKVVSEESFACLCARIHQVLSEYENRVWNLYIAGYRSGEIAEKLGKSPHSIENAVYRIRAKLRAALRK